MTEDTKRNKLIDERLDRANQSARIEGAGVSDQELERFKDMLKSGKTPDECIDEIFRHYKNE